MRNTNFYYYNIRLDLSNVIKQRFIIQFDRRIEDTMPMLLYDYYGFSYQFLFKLSELVFILFYLLQMGYLKRKM